jgi:phosphoenolpyruvate carboxykinase (ATP)
LADYAAQNKTSVWMLNTGWMNGKTDPASRIPLPVSRAFLRAIQSGALNAARFTEHPVFGFGVPTTCPDVDPSWLQFPQGDQVWALAQKFHANIGRFSSSAALLDSRVLSEGGPRLTSSAAA